VWLEGDRDFQSDRLRLNRQKGKEMKRITLATMVLGLLLSVGWIALAQEDKKADAPEGAEVFKTLREKVSYAVGLNLGMSFKQEHMKVDADMVARGIRDVLEGHKPLLTAEQIKEAVVSYRQQLARESEQRNRAFLEANKLKEGVKTLPSGLQYKVLKQGSGESPGPDDTFKAHYRGWLIDGREFDSSYRKGEPLEYQVGKMIPGWQEALQKMKPGDKWQLFIPADLAYGMNPPPKSIIPPNAILVFEVELLGFEKGKPEAQPQVTQPKP